MAVYQEGVKPRYGFLSLTWAIISDVDILSENLRCLGPYVPLSTGGLIPSALVSSLGLGCVAQDSVYDWRH